LKLILRRVWQRTFMLKDLAQITAIDPATAGGAADEVSCFVRGRLADEPANVLSALDQGFGGNL
jgi:hypothetical protein